MGGKGTDRPSPFEAGANNDQTRKEQVFWTDCLARFIRDDQAQDLVEYGLLLGTLAAVGVALFPQIISAMSAAFLQWNLQINDKWIPLDPL